MGKYRINTAPSGPRIELVRKNNGMIKAAYPTSCGTGTCLETGLESNSPGLLRDYRTSSPISTIDDETLRRMGQVLPLDELLEIRDLERQLLQP